MDIKMLVATFLIGGTAVSASAYFGSQSKSIVAALISQLPLISAMTLLAIYVSVGSQASESYAKNILLMAPALVAYFLSLFFLIPRVGVIWSLAAGFTVFLGVSYIAARIFP
jgi:hypothetical protein